MKRNSYKLLLMTGSKAKEMGSLNHLVHKVEILHCRSFAVMPLLADNASENCCGKSLQCIHKKDIWLGAITDLFFGKNTGRTTGSGGHFESYTNCFLFDVSIFFFKIQICMALLVFDLIWFIAIK